MHPSGIRRAHVNAGGIVWYVDEPEDLLSHFHLAIATLDVPENPADVFAGSISFDGVVLDAETTEATLKGTKSIQLCGRHHQWWYDTPGHNITLCFERIHDPAGKRLRTPRLARVCISFHGRAVPG